TDFDRRNQSGITPYKHPILDNRFMLMHAGVVAGNSPGADIDAFSDFRIAEASKVIGLRSLAQTNFFCLYKVAHFRAFTDITAWPQPGVRSQGGFVLDP